MTIYKLIHTKLKRCAKLNALFLQQATYKYFNTH